MWKKVALWTGISELNYKVMRNFHHDKLIAFGGRDMLVLLQIISELFFPTIKVTN